jgi:hypothetical protein
MTFPGTNSRHCVAIRWHNASFPPVNHNFLSLSFGEFNMATASSGVIRTDEAYSKQMVLQRLGISQKFWDKMLSEGLPYTTVGHTRWVTGQALIEHLSRNAERKNS